MVLPVLLVGAAAAAGQDAGEEDGRKTTASPPAARSAPATTNRVRKPGLSTFSASGTGGSVIGSTGSKGSRFNEARCEMIISVVGDIAPDWADTLRSQYVENPAVFSESIRPYARRLTGLGMLRERNPELYALRVAELALKRGLREKAMEYHRMKAANEASIDLLAMESIIRDLSKESVDLELRARAMELAALAEAVKEMKNLLLQETTVRQARIDALAESLLSTPPEGTSFNEALDSLPGPPVSRPSGLRGSKSAASKVETSE